MKVYVLEVIDELTDEKHLPRKAWRDRRIAEMTAKRMRDEGVGELVNVIGLDVVDPPVVTSGYLVAGEPVSVETATTNAEGRRWRR